MKKQLLLGSALLAAISAFPQSNRVKPQPSGVINMAEIIERKFSAIEPTQAAKPSNTPVNNVMTPQGETEQASSVAMPPSSISWKQISGSSNVYGQLVSNSKPLNYNPDVKAVSYIHRKSAAYVASPPVGTTGQSGVIVADISSDLGLTWDSTCFWASSTNWGRYPQGAIYSAPGNTSIANAYVVGSGPIVSNDAFTGNWFASKKLAAPGSTLYNTTADPAIGAQNYQTFASSNTSWARYGFTSSSNGIVRSLALVQGNGVTLGNAAKMRGVTVVKGTFAAGVFNWSFADSIIPTTYTLSALQGTNVGVKVLASDVQMAWNQAGDVGYVVLRGAAPSGTNLVNRGYQPIIYKTTNSGTSWTNISGIDFTAPSMSVVTNPLIASQAAGVSNSLSAPYFNQYDIAVDANNRLHIGATVVGSYYSHPDSLGYTAVFSADKYAWAHVPGLRPFIYDFVGDGSGPWKVLTVDTMSTEDPGADPSQPGFALNPWDAGGTNGAKVNIDPRLQLARTPDGNYITFSWAESDTNFIQNTKKWNVIPDIKARCVSAVNGSLIVSDNKINVSKVAAGQGTNNVNVAGKAFLHYMTGVTAGQTTYTGVTTTTIDINTPFTVTNSSPLSQLTNNRNWYTGAKLSWAYTVLILNIKDNNLNSAVNSVIYPNPTKNNATLSVDLKQNTSLDVNVYNLVGQLVKTTKAEGQLGENNINVDLSNLTAGIYMVNVNVGGSVSTKKLIIE
jgi:hypothetical protein